LIQTVLFEKRNQDFIISYDTVGEVSMNAKKWETASDRTESYAPMTKQKNKEIQFIKGTMEMKALFQELIACRIRDQYEG